jgi:hypothetical protein
MAAPKKATHVVVHRKLFMAVGGKLQHVKAGTEVTLTPVQAKGLEAKGRVMKIGDQKAVDLTPDESDKADA